MFLPWSFCLVLFLTGLVLQVLDSVLVLVLLGDSSVPGRLSQAPCCFLEHLCLSNQADPFAPSSLLFHGPYLSHQRHWTFVFLRRFSISVVFPCSFILHAKHLIYLLFVAYLLLLGGSSMQAELLALSFDVA